MNNVNRNIIVTSSFGYSYQCHLDDLRIVTIEDSFMKCCNHFILLTDRLQVDMRGSKSTAQQYGGEHAYLNKEARPLQTLSVILPYL